MPYCDDLLSDETMRSFYGDLFTQSPTTRFDRDEVPSQLMALAHYAEFWGISDDGIRDHLVANSSSAVRKNLIKVIRYYDDALDAWLAGPEAENPYPSEAYVAYSAMRMASDLAQALEGGSAD